MLVKTPDRTYNLGEKGLPSLGQPVVSWPWGGTPHLTQWSIDALKYPLGTIIQDVIDGHPVIAQIQTHDTYGAHPEWGIKLHKGTSVFVPTVVDGATGKTVAMRDPPDGWGVSPMGACFGGDRNRVRRVERREWRSPISRTYQHDPFVEAVQIIERQDDITPSVSPLPQLQSSSPPHGDPMPHDDWKSYFTRIPKLAVVAGSTIAGLAIVGTPVGAAIGLLAGLFVDKEVRGGPWLPSFHGESPEERRRLWDERFHQEGDRGRREHRQGWPREEHRRPPPPTALNSWERWEQIHPGTPYQDYVNWFFQYGANGASINGDFGSEGSWKVKRYDPSTGQFFYVGAVNAGSEGSAMDAACQQLFSCSAAKPYSLPGFTNVYITSGGDVFRLGMES